ncbi:hypothetical protein D9M68_806980 [compost metagenome]
MVIVGARHLRRGDVAAGAGTVLDHHRLAQGPGQRLGQQARREVGRGTTGKTHHDLERPVGPGGLRLRGGQHGGGHQGCGGGQGVAAGGCCGCRGHVFLLEWGEGVGSCNGSGGPS